VVYQETDFADNKTRMMMGRLRDKFLISRASDTVVEADSPHSPYTVPYAF
jgi:hypothetical protein